MQPTFRSMSSTAKAASSFRYTVPQCKHIIRWNTYSVEGTGDKRSTYHTMLIRIMQFVYAIERMLN